MKHLSRISSLVAILLVVMLAAAIALAGSVYDRETKTLGATTGTGTWTNTQQYGNVLLKRIWIEDSLSTATTVTVTRVLSDNSYTQAVGTVALAGTAYGSSASFTASYLKYGDKLAFAGAVATGATAIIEYELQKH